MNPNIKKEYTECVPIRRHSCGCSSTASSSPASPIMGRPILKRSTQEPPIANTFDAAKARSVSTNSVKSLIEQFPGLSICKRLEKEEKSRLAKLRSKNFDFTPLINQATAQKKRYLCRFCKNNGESEEIYTCHNKLDKNGETTCPILATYECSICYKYGHTFKYCRVLLAVRKEKRIMEHAKFAIAYKA